MDPKSGKYSTIDQQIVSINILIKIYIKKIENLCTDHFAIVSSLNEPAKILPHIPKYVNTKANWTIFRKKLNDEILSFAQNSHTSVVTVDTHAKVMTSILTNTANHAILKTSPRKTIPKHAPKARWTKDCQIIWRIKNATRRTYLKNHPLLHI